MSQLRAVKDKPALRKFRDHIEFINNEDGILTASSIFFVILFLLLGGLAVDYTNGVRAKAHLQATADAASLAAVQDLPDETIALVTAKQFAALNAPENRYGAVIANNDIVFGNWNPLTRSMEFGDRPYNAVSVIVHRRKSDNNPVPTFLLRLGGIFSWNVQARSIAIRTLENAGPCSSGGLFSKGVVYSGSNNDYIDFFCLHGDQGVTIQSNNTFQSGTIISMNDHEEDFVESQDNVIPEGTLKSAEYEFPLIKDIPILRRELEKGDLSRLPDFITRVEPLDEITDSTVLVSGTLYIVDGVADFGSNVTIKNIAVVARKEIKTGSNVTMTNSFFVTNDKILFGSTNEFGSSDFCDTEKYSIQAYSGDNIEFGSQSLFQGMQLAAGGEIKLGSELRGIMGLYGQSAGNVDYGSADEYGGCPNGLSSQIESGEDSKPVFGLVY